MFKDLNMVRDIAFIIAVLIEIIVPLIIAVIIARKYKTSWAIFFLGMLLFFVSMIRVPLNSYVSGIIQSKIPALYVVPGILLFASITAGIFEEGVRVLAFGAIIKKKDYYNGLMYGIGHGGGGESMMFVGLSTLANFIIYRFFPGILPEAAIMQLNNTQWYMPLVGALERIFAIIIQLALSVLVMNAFIKKRYYFITIAVIIHIVVDFTATYINYRVGTLYSEISVMVFALAGVATIIMLRPKYPPAHANNSNGAKFD
jgi:uncharacterized membrane protein YhfC